MRQETASHHISLLLRLRCRAEQSSEVKEDDMACPSLGAHSSQLTAPSHTPGGPSVKRSLVSALEKYLEEDPLSVTMRTPSLNT